MWERIICLRCVDTHTHKYWHMCGFKILRNTLQSGCECNFHPNTLISAPQAALSHRVVRLMAHKRMHACMHARTHTHKTSQFAISGTLENY